MRGAESLRLFRIPNFTALWLGQLVSIFGDRFTYLALLALVVESARDRSNPAAELALIPLVSFLPAILLAPAVGALVDRWNTRTTLIVSDACRGLIVAAIIPAAGVGGLSAALALVFLLYVANTFFLPARSAILPDLVPRDRLVEANSLATLAGVIGTIAGAVIGGIVVERSGWRIGFLLDAATYFVSVAALALIRMSPRVDSEGARPASARAPQSRGAGEAYRALALDVREGARIAISSRTVLGSMAALALLWIAGGALHVAVPTLLEQRGGLGAGAGAIPVAGTGMVSGVGVLLGFVAAGMVAGTLILAARGHGAGGARVRWALAMAGASLLLFATQPAYVTMSIAAMGAGFSVALLLVTTESLIQEAVPGPVRARVFALRDFLARVGVVLSAGAFGGILHAGWATPPVAVGAAGLLLGLGAVAFRGGTDLRRSSSPPPASR
jgi:MFS family permease